MSFKALGLIVVVAAVLIACAPAQIGTPAPPDLRYSEDVCEVCGMIISEARFAAACVTTDGEGHIFDGIGEMLIFLHDRDFSGITQCFVHDYETEDWLAAEAAVYVTDASFNTPMGWGTVAFTNREPAQVLAGQLGVDILDWEDLQSMDPRDSR